MGRRGQDRGGQDATFLGPWVRTNSKGFEASENPARDSRPCWRAASLPFDYCPCRKRGPAPRAGRDRAAIVQPHQAQWPLVCPLGPRARHGGQFFQLLSWEKVFSCSCQAPGLDWVGQGGTGGISSPPRWAPKTRSPGRECPAMGLCLPTSAGQEPLHLSHMACLAQLLMGQVASDKSLPFSKLRLGFPGCPCSWQARLKHLT